MHFQSKGETMLREFSFDSSTLKDAWENLYGANSWLLPYSSRRYSELFNKYYWARGRRLLFKRTFLGFYDEAGQLIMIVPLCIKDKEIYIFGDLANEEILDFIYNEEINPEYFGKLLQELQGKFKGYRLILNRLAPDSLLHQWLQKNNYQSVRLKSCAKLQLPASYNEYLKTLSNKTRYNVKHSVQLITNLPDQYKLEFLRGPISRKIRTECFKLYEQREAEREGKKRSFWNRYRRKELNALTDACTQESDSLNVLLYIGDELVAFSSNFFDLQEKRLICRKTAIASSYGKCSPGIFLHTQTIKWLIEETEAECMDFAGGHEAYKYWLGCEEYFCYSYEIAL